ncbi:3-oxoacyl-[acyl-carrier protein] reductase [Minicystis rosea]|nr:3-oxoacyl-[acyl-carrier protein] reductase [Minicystis rosea]
MSKTVAFITGANKGLGLEIARQLGKKGLTVVLGARDEAKGNAAVEKLKGEDIDAHFVKVDVSSQADVDRLPAFFQEKFGRLDVLVNNAGVAEWMNDDLGTFRRTLEANLFGVVAVTYALLPLIKQSPAGRIVNHSSILGSLGTITTTDMFGDFVNPAYTTSKAALNGFTVALAHRLRGTNVKVNSAHPGWVKTDLGSDAAPMEIVDGAKTAVALATLPADGPTGSFIHMGDRLPW